MLRNLFVLALAAVGVYYALHGPFYALLFYVGNAYFRPETWVSTELIRYLNLSLISGWFVVLASLVSRQQVVINSRVVFLFFFLLHTFLSALLTEHFEYSWGHWLEFFKIAVVTYLMVVLVKDYDQLRLLLLVMVLSLGALQAKQGWYYLITSPTWPNTNPIQFLGDNNGVAVGMLMLVPVIALLAQTAQRKWVRTCFWILLIGVLYRALSTYSRGGFLACIGLGGVYLFRSQHKVRALLGIAAVVMITLLALPVEYWGRMNTILTFEQKEETSAISRLHFWRVAVAMANAHPFFGIGHNAYDRAYNDYDFSDGQYGTDRAVHSSFFGVLAETGYVGLALYVTILVLALRSCHRVRRLTAMNAKSLEMRRCIIAIEASLVAFIIGGAFVAFQYNEMLWNYIGISMILENIAISGKSIEMDEIFNEEDGKDFIYSAQMPVSAK